MIKWLYIKFTELESNSLKQYMFLLVITLTALALRFYKLGEWSFWGDEIITLRQAEDIFEIKLISWSLSKMLIHIALNLLDISEWSARLVPALIGVVSIPILYFPIRKLFGPAVALLSMLLLAVSPWHLYWSQNVRFYTTLLLFYTSALLAFYWAIEEDRLDYLILSLILFGLATIERQIGLFFVPVVFLYVVLLRILPIEKPPGLRLRNLGLFFLPGLIFGLFLLYSNPTVREWSLWLERFGWVNTNPLWILSGVVYYVGIPTICMGALGGLYLLRIKNRASLLFGLGAVVPLLSIMIVSLFQYAANRYVFISLLSWIILASVAVRELLVQSQRSARILVLGVLMILVLAPLSENVLYYQFQNGNRVNWRAAIEFVQQQKAEGDLIIVPDSRLAEYYLQEETYSMGGVDLTQIRENAGRVWFVEDVDVKDKFPQIYEWMLENSELVAIFDVNLRARNFIMRVYVYDPPIP